MDNIPLEDIRVEYDRLSEMRNNIMDGMAVDESGGLAECTELCPRHELLHRLLNNEISDEEWVDGKLVAIKKYYRSAAGYGGSLPCDIRTVPALYRATRHLLGLGGSFSFLDNRLRAIRNDLLIQKDSILSMGNMGKWGMRVVWILLKLTSL